MSDHKLFLCTHVLWSLQLPPTQADPFREAQPGLRCPCRGIRNLLFLPQIQRVADTAITSKASEGPLKDTGLSQSIYFHRFGRRQTSYIALLFSWSDKGPPTLPPRAGWHHKTQDMTKVWTSVWGPSQREQVTGAAAVCHHSCSIGTSTLCPNSD